MAAADVRKGLDGVKADTTAVSTCGNHSAGLTYRGYLIEDLANNCVFEEVAFLLMEGRLPTGEELTALTARLASQRALPPGIKAALELMPGDSHPMDVLRTVASLLGCLEQERNAPGKADTGATCYRLMAVFVSSMCYWHHFTTSGKRIEINTSPQDGLASSVLKMLRDDPSEPDALDVRVIDAAYILYAEHDFAASTFTARVVSSTLSDTYSSISAAIGALRGPLHGGANEAVMHMIKDLKSPEEGVAMIQDMLSRKQLVMGFGHRIYKNGDPRNAIFKALSHQLSQRENGQPVLYEVSCKIEEHMEQSKRMFPNADFYAASSYYQVGIPIHFFTPLFVVARTAGWCAHIKEQMVGNRLIRPSSAYVGPDLQAFVPLSMRVAEEAVAESPSPMCGGKGGAPMVAA